MALITCPECGKSFSDKAPACPECGCPTSEIVGTKTNVSEGQLIIANNAFDDGRFEEAYQLYSQIFMQEQDNPQVMVRLGLSTAAKDYCNNGIPDSTLELYKKGLERAKSDCSTSDEFISAIIPFVNDADSIIKSTKSFIASDISSAMKKLEYQRSSKSMITDALFMPTVTAQRNLYEDRRTIESNKRIIENALANKSVITRNLDRFGSEILKITAEFITEPLKNDSELYLLLGNFVVDKDDSQIYEKLAEDAEPSKIAYGLCYGEEKTIIDFNNVTSLVLVNDKPRVSGFLPPKGHLVLTNYKVKYDATKSKFSFEFSLDNLISVSVGGPGDWKTHIVLTFANNTKVFISPEKAGTQGIYVPLINEELKLSNR